MVYVLYTHYRRCAGILSEKYCEKMSETFVCRFPKLGSHSEAFSCNIELALKMECMYFAP